MKLWNMFVTMVLLSVFVTAAEGAEKQVSNLPLSQKFRLSFTLHRIERSDFDIKKKPKETHISGVQKIDGVITWKSRGDDYSRCEISVENIVVDCPSKDPLKRFVKVNPFIAEITVDKTADVLIAIQVTKGKMDESSVEYTAQIGTAFRVLNMMMADGTKTEIIPPRDKDDNNATLKVTYPERAKIGEHVSEVAWMYQKQPVTFNIFPRILNPSRRGWELYSFAKDAHKINYSYRFLDRDWHIATHAFDLDVVAFKEDFKDQDMDLAILDNIDKPEKFRDYLLIELKIISED